MTYERLAEFFGPRIIYAKLAAITLWVCYAGSLLLGPGTHIWVDRVEVRPGDGVVNTIGEVVLADHLAFYTAARLIREGQPERTYDLAFLVDYQAKLFEPPGRWSNLMAYRNPPFYALLYWPTSGLPFPVSAWLWNLIGLILTWFGIGWLTGGRERRFWFLWALAFYPIFCVISYGQNTLLSFSIFAGTFFFLHRRRPFAAGLVAGLLLFKPQLLLGLILWGLLDFRKLWPCALGVIVTGIALSGVSYFIIPEVWQAFVQQLRDNVQFDNFEFWKLHTPLGFFKLLLPEFPSAHRPLALLCGAVSFAVFVQLWRRCRDDLPIMFGAAVYLTLWASPHAMIYEWGLLLVPAILWRDRFASRPALGLILYVVAFFILFVSTHLTELQVRLQGFNVDVGYPRAVQLSIPVLAWVGWRAVRHFRETATKILPEPAPVA